LSTHSKVSLVIFDAVGTLLEPSPPVVEAYLRHAVSFGVQLSPDQVRARFRQAMAAQAELDRQAQGRTGAERELARWSEIVAQVFAELDDSAPLFDRLWQHFAEPVHWRVPPDAALALARLEAAGIPWGIGSNFDDRLLGLCAGLAPLKRCPRERVFVSSRVGYLKPFAEFYRHIERALDLPPEELLMVGDDPANDYAGAQAAGWQAEQVGTHRSVLDVVRRLRGD
jgi:putative hydrolase of the HAD superfamily